MDHTVRKAAGQHRRWIFAVIVLLMVLYSAYHVVLFLMMPRSEAETVVPAALPGPILMFTVLILGLGWLIWLVTARRR